jgi:hypothetical protein
VLQLSAKFIPFEVYMQPGLGCAVRFRLKRNEAKKRQKIFRFEAKKCHFFACFASKRNTGNHKRNENERSEKSNAKRKRTEKIAKQKCRMRPMAVWNT